METRHQHMCLIIIMIIVVVVVDVCVSDSAVVAVAVAVACEIVFGGGARDTRESTIFGLVNETTKYAIHSIVVHLYCRVLSIRLRHGESSGNFIEMSQ